jgi:hypothetical protein
MAVELYDTRTMLEVQRVQKRPLIFWLTNFFKKQINFQTDEIVFDRVSEDYRRLAPFVAPNVQGKIMKLEGYDTVRFKPAYLKPKHVVDADTAIARQPGESLDTGSLTLEQRRDAVIANILERHKNMHVMTQEWMAANAVINGYVDVEGDGYPKVRVNFNRDAALTATLTGTAKWDQSTSNPLADIKTMRVKANDVCGATIRDIIFGSAAWASFSSKLEIQELLDTMSRGSDTDFTKLNDGFGNSVEYLGRLSGANGAGITRLWLYTGQYVDETGTVQLFLPTNAVVGVDGDMLDGYRCFGAIKDGKAGFQALEMFPKMWEEEDPWVEYVMTQSAPLMVPKQPNASFKLIVQ